MKLLLSLAAFLVSCASQSSISKADDYPYDFAERSHIPDFLSLKSPDDLRDLLLTLPVFEISPDERRQWIFDHSEVSANQVHIEGDGAQSSLMLSRLFVKDHYLLKIGPEEDASMTTYELRRMESGWIVLSRSRHLTKSHP